MLKKLKENGFFYSFQLSLDNSRFMRIPATDSPSKDFFSEDRRNDCF